MKLRTCVDSNGNFVYGIHKSSYLSLNFRQHKYDLHLGRSSKLEIKNEHNFPTGNIAINDGGWVFELPNAFPSLGTTFIQKEKADKWPGLTLEQQTNRGMYLRAKMQRHLLRAILPLLPERLKRMAAQLSDDPRLLIRLAKSTCRFEYDAAGRPIGVFYNEENKMEIGDQLLFDILENNPYLPNDYKRIMVLNPGVIGPDIMVGNFISPVTNVFEYLRGKSYLPWGHYVSTMACDTIRYSERKMTKEDMAGLRHLYYQRIYSQLAKEKGIDIEVGQSLSESELEILRQKVVTRGVDDILFSACIWGHNFGFEVSPSGYNLNASHQQIHQQYGLVPRHIKTYKDGENKTGLGTFLSTYIQGDEIALFTDQYRQETGLNFFDIYLKAIRNNQRIDGETGRPKSIIIKDYGPAMLFVPKAQRSPWEIQIMATGKTGNILEADLQTRRAFDQAILDALVLLERIGATMINTYEVSKRFDVPDDKVRLTYVFLPKVPATAWGWCELQNRWIIGHYPEDFAAASRKLLS